jgi:hypothetical protein
MTVEYTMTSRRSLLMQAEGELPAAAGRPPRIACLLALAYRFDELVRSGAVRDYAELARLGHVTRARVTQIMNLLNLAPDIQEDILWLPPGRRAGSQRGRCAGLSAKSAGTGSGSCSGSTNGESRPNWRWPSGCAWGTVAVAVRQPQPDSTSAPG